MPRLTLSDLTSAAAVQAALDEFTRSDHASFLARHGFGISRDWVVRDPRTRVWADSKAIAGVALAYQYPGSEGLRAEDLSGGEATVVPRLRALGFEVSQISGVTGGEWSRAEVETVVADYLDMLTRELTGQTYNKAAHRRSLGAALPARSEGAIEFKHANISAVMLELGFPYLKGYKPRAHFQRQILIDVVSQRLASHRMLDEAALAAVQRPVECADILDFRKVRAEAPKRELAAREQSPDAFRAVKRDYLEREALNRSLGMAGEEFAFRFEQWRLIELGAGQLAGQVQHVSRSQGDGLGYDILSFEHDGRQRFIEVKTTTFGERTPFFVSANELRFAQGHADDFHLYRLFDFRTSPRLFELNGPIERHCALDPTTYRASFG